MTCRSSSHALLAAMRSCWKRPWYQATSSIPDLLMSELARRDSRREENAREKKNPHQLSSILPTSIGTLLRIVTSPAIACPGMKGGECSTTSNWTSSSLILVNKSANCTLGGVESDDIEDDSDCVDFTFFVNMFPDWS